MPHTNQISQLLIVFDSQMNFADFINEKQDEQQQMATLITNYITTQWYQDAAVYYTITKQL